MDLTLVSLQSAHLPKQLSESMEADTAALPVTISMTAKSTFLDTVLNPTTKPPSIAAWAFPKSADRDKYHPDFPPGTSAVCKRMQVYQGYTCWMCIHARGITVGGGRLPQNLADAARKEAEDLEDPKPPTAPSSRAGSPMLVAPTRDNSEPEPFSDASAVTQGLSTLAINAEGVPDDATETCTSVAPIYSDHTLADGNSAPEMPTQDFDIATEPQDMSYDSNDASFAAEEAFEPSDPTMPPEAPGTFQPAQHEPSVKYHFVKPNQVTRHLRRIQTQPYPPPSMVTRWALRPTGGARKLPSRERNETAS